MKIHKGKDKKRDQKEGKDSRLQKKIVNRANQSNFCSK